MLATRQWITTNTFISQRILRNLLKNNDTGDGLQLLKNLAKTPKGRIQWKPFELNHFIPHDTHRAAGFPL